MENKNMNEKKDNATLNERNLDSTPDFFKDLKVKTYQYKGKGYQMGLREPNVGNEEFKAQMEVMHAAPGYKEYNAARAKALSAEIHKAMREDLAADQASNEFRKKQTNG